MALGVTWTAQTTPADNAWKAVAFGKGRFVAVAYSGVGNRVMTSDNGVDWTIRTSAADNDWYDVCYSDSLGLFVAVARSGTGDRVMTSPNGIDWTLRTSAEDNTWYAVTWSEEKSLFVAVSGNGTNQVMTSPDGINWTARTTPSRNWQGVAYGNGVFAAVGTSNDAMWSSDGITWNLVAIGGGSMVWKDVIWSEDVGLFVAVSNGGDSGGRVATSPDGKVWTQRTSGYDSYSWTDVTYGSGLFVASSVGGSTYDKFMSSPDGINWTIGQADIPSRSYYGIGYGYGIFVAVSISGTGNRVETSGTYTLPEGIAPAPYDALKAGTADVLLFQTNDDSDVTMVAGQLQMTDGFETMIYLALFGGNEEDPGGDDKSQQWWANFLSEDHQYRSETQHLLLSIPAIPANLNRIKQAVKRDLQVFIDEEIANTVDVEVTMPTLNRVNITVVIKAEDEESTFNYIGNWKAMT